MLSEYEIAIRAKMVKTSRFLWPEAKKTEEKIANEQKLKKKASKRYLRQKFENSKEWRALSLLVRAEEPMCRKCGATEELQADHIKPKSKYPELALVRSNIQTLCWTCNRIKAAR